MRDLRIWYDSLSSEGKNAVMLSLILIGLVVAGIINLFSPAVAPFSFLIIALASAVFTFYTPRTYGGILATIFIVIGGSAVFLIFSAAHDGSISNLVNSFSLWGFALTLFLIIWKIAKTDTRFKDDEKFHSVDIKNRLEEWIKSNDWKNMDNSKAKEMRKMLYILRIPEYGFEPQNSEDELSAEEKRELDNS